MLFRPGLWPAGWPVYQGLPHRVLRSLRCAAGPRPQAKMLQVPNKANWENILLCPSEMQQELIAVIQGIQCFPRGSEVSRALAATFHMACGVPLGVQPGLSVKPLDSGQRGWGSWISAG